MNKLTSLNCRKILLILFSMLLVYTCLGKSGKSLEISSESIENQDSIFVFSNDEFSAEDSIDPEVLKTLLEQLGADIFKTNSTPEENKPFNFIPYEDAPEPINPFPPQYSDFARRTGLEGTVILEVNVYKDGTVGHIKVKKSLWAGPEGLDEAAINAVKKWKFIPGKVGGKPIDTTVIIPIEFEISHKNSNHNVPKSNTIKEPDSLYAKEDVGFSHPEDVISPPKPINPIFPDYPRKQRKLGIEGVVYLKVDVLRDGTVGEIKVMQSVNKGRSGLDEVAVNAVKKWKFIPGKKNGKWPIDTKVIIPVEFYLSKDKPHQDYYTVVFESYETPPKVVKSVEPVYPNLRIKPIYGLVYLEVEVFISGQIGEIKILKSLLSGPGGLDEAAIEAVRQWEFKPGLNKASKEINTRIIVPVEFTAETKRKSY